MLESVFEVLNVSIVGEVLIIFLSGFLLCICIVWLSRRRRSKQIFSDAYTDRLTGHDNGLRFEQRANETIKNKEKKYVLYSADIKRFKYINECYGRNYGDLIIKAIAKILSQTVSRDTLFARMDVDRFVILASYDGWNEITQNFAKYEAILKKEFPKHGVQVQLGFACGIYILDGKEEDITVAYDRAEFARKEAKRKTLSNVVVFNEKMKYRIHLERMMEEEMEAALVNEEFQVYFQPQYDLSSLKFIGVEALIRWDSKKLGFLYPDSFIDFFEKNGFISRLDFFVLKIVCDRMEKLHKGGQPLYNCSVNHSRVTILSNNYLKNLKDFLKKYTFPKEKLEIEVTENVFIDAYSSAVDIINGIKELGVCISMDDFGSGYSSLNILKKISINVLKIDKDFLDQAMAPKTMAIVRGIVNMAKEIALSVICEGVETKEQVEFLREIGCDKAQGYYFAKPMPIPEIEKKIFENFIS